MTSEHDKAGKASPPVEPDAQSPNRDDAGEEWRHAPVAPKDEGPLESLGKSVSEVVTGPDADRSRGPKP